MSSTTNRLSSSVEEQPSRGWRKTFRLRLPYGASFFLRHRETMIPSDYGPALQENVLCFDGDLSSQGWIILGAQHPGQYLLVGALSANRSMTYLTLHVRQKRFESLSVSQPDTPAGATEEPLVILEGDDWRRLLETYAQRVSHHHGLPERRIAEPPSCGYCSWYYSYQNVTEAEFFQNLQGLIAYRDLFPARIAQIDDGYQLHHGDWLSSRPEWPSPLSRIAARISEAGLVPGLWSMPLLASSASRLFGDHPDWFVRDRTGDLIRIPGWSPEPENQWLCLDASRTEVQQHLRTLFRMLYEYGFRYFKLDGLGLSYPDGIRAEREASGISALREGLRVIREAVGDSLILSCGAPYLAAVGWVDHARMSGDTGTRWKAVGVPGESVPREARPWEYADPTMPGLFNALEQTLQHWWMFDRWFRADPDVVMARDEATFLTAGQARMSALAAVVTGVLFTSDHLERMSPERRGLLARIASLRMSRISPASTVPDPDCGLFVGEIAGDPAVAIFNWSGEAHTIDLTSFGFPGTAGEWLHPGGTVPSQKITVSGYDAALIRWQ